ncbi:MAG TPA: A/G-specific adenine glycosylase [Candidatus Manganitrophaceae bacterium]|nr:A/G-specific adenine glycosylase [Candidatus Manganitrophaceae bacterium]
MISAGFQDELMAGPPDPAAIRRLTRNLLKWYRGFGRDLPWRRTRDPYAVWVSEIMLQQTQVATVLPYYQRFLSAFPTVHDLAAAPLDRVLKSWEGLGYYARARNLRRAAQEVIDRFEGSLPSTFEDILALPGIGRSTAGAILTIAFGRRHPILDGNVRRVLCRYFCVEEDPREKSVEARLWRVSEALLPKKDADLYTQAIMDLGATVCAPVRPRCPVCPVQGGCLAYQKGLQASLPRKGARKSVPHHDYVAGVIEKGGKVLVRRRPAGGLLGGLWEFPGGRVDGKPKTPLLSAVAAGPFLENETGIKIAAAEPLIRINHAFTHFRMTLHVFSCRTDGAGLKISSNAKWVHLKKLSDYPFSSAHQKILQKLISQDGAEQAPLFK